MGETLGNPFGFVGVEQVDDAASHSVAVVLNVSVLVTLLFLLSVGVRLLFMLAVLSLTLDNREVSDLAVSEEEEQEEGAELPKESGCTGSEKSNMMPFSSVAMTMLDTMLVRSSTLFGGGTSSSEFASSASALGALPLGVTLSLLFSWPLPPKRASSSSFSSWSSLGLFNCGTTGMRTFFACRGSREYWPKGHERMADLARKDISR